MAKKKSVRRRNLSKRKSKSVIAAEALKASQTLSDHYQRQTLERSNELTRANAATKAAHDRIGELKAEIAWFKQLVQNLETKIGKGVVVTNA